ncbi:MazG-like family protein [Aeromonas sp.]|uniref:MazG-like family protein n=1 Tax=Aeromonas sp. TaxID=647 RepID=UPI00258FC615|nr:MazG-like family protein [Aeromonas sp.]MCX7132316.1 MazG-like family protein [Aeromonas sp.]
MKRYDLELTATGPVMEERQEGCFVPFSEISGLADTVVRMGDCCTLLSDLLRELRDGIEGEWCFPGDLAERIDAALAGKLPGHAVSVTETIRTAPERIWLQVGDQEHYHSEPFPRDTGEVSWCADSVVGCEVPYVRADLAGKLPEQGGVNGFHLLREANHLRQEEWDIGSEKVSLSFLGNELAGETGELCNVLKKLERERIGIVGSRSTVEKAATELADVVICADLVARALGINTWDAVCNKFNYTSAKYGLKTMLFGTPNLIQQAVRTITEGQEFELTTALQAIANGFSDDPAHDAAALLKRITGEVPWTGDSFQIPPRQGGDKPEGAT